MARHRACVRIQCRPDVVVVVVFEIVVIFALVVGTVPSSVNVWLNFMHYAAVLLHGTST